MTKKTKKAAKKPRPKTKTVTAWLTHCNSLNEPQLVLTTEKRAKQYAGDCDQVVRITYEVRR